MAIRPAYACKGKHDLNLSHRLPKQKGSLARGNRQQALPEDIWD